MDITRLSITRPIVVIVFFLLVILLGVYSYTRLNYELVPKFTPEIITVTTVYPGASPRQVEEDVSRVIEDAVSGVENVEILTSVSTDNFSLVRLELLSGTAVDMVLIDVQRKVTAQAGNLPEAARPPVITRFDFGDLPVIRMGVSSGLPEEELFRLIRDQVVPELARQQGVAEVRVLGGREREIRVDVSNDMLNYYGITILQVIQAIELNNQDVPVGNIRSGSDVQSLRFAGKFRSVAELEEISVYHPRTKAAIPLKSVAQIYTSLAENRIINRVNLKNSIGLEIRKRGGANAVDMSARVREAVDLLETRYAKEGLEFNVSQDSSEFTLRAADAVLEDLGYAIILVSLVMLLFLHSLRNSIIVLVSIPLSIISTFLVMFLAGYTLNLLSLLGLSLAIGILVDDSIVVIENIYRHLEMGKERREAAYEGRMEIGFTALSITMIDVVVFVPIILSSGMVADLLRQFSVVILVSTLMSLLVSFTVVPLLVSRFGKLEIASAKSFTGRIIRSIERLVDAFGEWITGLLRQAVKYKILTLALALILFAGSVGLILWGFIGVEFIKGGDRGEFLMELELPRGSSIEHTDEVVREVEAYLATRPEITGIFTTVGITSAGRIEFNSEYLAELTVKLIPKETRERAAFVIAREIKLALESHIPGLKVRPIDINLIGLRDEDAVQVSVASQDEDLLYSFSERLYADLDSIRGTAEVTKTASGRTLEMVVEPDRQLMDIFKVNPLYAGAVMRTAVYGNRDNTVLLPEGESDIVVQFQAKDKSSVQDLLSAEVYNEMGQPVPLGQFLHTRNELSSGQLERTNRIPSVTIKSQVIGRTGGQVNSEFKDKIQESNVPENVYLIYGGQTKRTQDGIQTMLVALAASIILVYFVLAILYNSFVYPFVVLFSIPMAMIGALLALALTMEGLSVFSILGLVMLVGLVGKNAILVVDFTNRLRSEGYEVKEALVKATKLRFRPVLMTNLSMIIGLIPIAIATGAGSEWKNGLAWVIIGGLSSSMFLTLIIVPVIYASLAGKMKQVTTASR